jgi:hypothetical protein
MILALIFIRPKHKYLLYAIIPFNVLYFAYIAYEYYKFINGPSTNLYTYPTDNNDKKGNKHLSWRWKHTFNYYYYVAINVINILLFYDNINIMSSMAVSYILLFISYMGFSEHLGEFWCLFVTAVPLLNLILQKVFNINN